ncbi:MAG TPA: CdaR family protein [Thermoanaerobaculia bacterium]|nr:CdaR family protein [Thermoanaerobaculia bacterium]
MSRSTIFSNLPSKLLALSLAVATWTVVSAPRRERVVELPFDVPLALVAVPKDLVVTTATRETISARLRGRLTVLRSLSAQNLAVTLDLSEYRAGDWIFTLRPQALNVPPEVEVVALEPTKVRLKLDPRRQKYVPIRPFLVGELPAGFTTDGVPEVIPEQALVSGPASLIRDVTEVATERIILTGRTASFRSTVGVTSENSMVSIVEPLNAQVSISVTTEAARSGAADTTTSTAVTEKSEARGVR